MPESGRRLGDTLLHDGEPRGARILRGKEVPVFNEVQLLEPSGFATYSATVSVPASNHVDALVELAFERQLNAEDWSTIRHICSACSEGLPGDHASCSEAQGSGERVIGIAAPDRSSVEKLLADWARPEEGREFGQIECDLPPPNLR